MGTGSDSERSRGGESATCGYGDVGRPERGIGGDSERAVICVALTALTALTVIPPMLTAIVAPATKLRARKGAERRCCLGRRSPGR